MAEKAEDLDKEWEDIREQWEEEESEENVGGAEAVARADLLRRMQAKRQEEYGKQCLPEGRRRDLAHRLSLCWREREDFAHEFKVCERLAVRAGYGTTWILEQIWECHQCLCSRGVDASFPPNPNASGSEHADSYKVSEWPEPKRLQLCEHVLHRVNLKRAPIAEIRAFLDAARALGIRFPAAPQPEEPEKCWDAGKNEPCVVNADEEKWYREFEPGSHKEALAATED